MKKIKYLIGSFIVGLGLLINHSFGYVPGLTIQLTDTQFATGFIDSDYSHSYSYRFMDQFHGAGCFLYDNQRYFDGYSVYYYSNILINRIRKQSNSNSSNACYNAYWNNSITGLDLYLDSCPNIGTNGTLYYNTNVATAPSSNSTPTICNFTGRHDILLGKGENFGQAFSYLNNQGFTSISTYPKFGFGNGFINGTDYQVLHDSDINYFIRLFYNSTGGVNNLYNRDYVGVDDSHNKPIFAWEYFTNTNTVTNFGYIVDTNGRKGKHFLGFGMGYSFVYNKDISLTGSKISWNTLGFTTVNDDSFQRLRGLGGLDLINRGGDSQYVNGLLVLRKYTYTNDGNEGVFVISKNPNNVKQLLYQEFSCQTNNFQCLARGQSTGSDGYLVNHCPSYIINNQTGIYNPCIILSQGVLSSGGNTEILPFTNKNSLVDVSSSPLLSALFNTKDGEILGTSYSFSNGRLCIAGLCYDKTSSSESIKELYLDSSLGQEPVINTTNITEQMILSCKGPFYNTPDGLPPAYCNTLGTEFTGNYYTSIGTDSSGNITITLVESDSNNVLGISTTEFVVDENGNYTATCTGDCNGLYIYYGNLNGETLSDTGYYESFLNSTGNFFKCPYPYIQKVVVGKKLSKYFLGYDIFLPINCGIASYLKGKQVILVGSGNNQLVSGFPILNGTGTNWTRLYMFFDFVFILGLTFFYLAIIKLFKH